MTQGTGNRGNNLYTLCAGIGVLIFFLGPALALLADMAPLPSATIGYAGITMFTGGVAARYGFALAADPWRQLGKNLLVALAVTVLFYLIFLIIYTI